jgi:hypothetical protein
MVILLDERDSLKWLMGFQVFCARLILSSRADKTNLTAIARLSVIRTLPSNKK